MTHDSSPFQSHTVAPACSLRPLTEDDLPQILPVEQRSYPKPWSEAHFRSEMEKPYSHQWVLTDDETDEVVMGYVVFWSSAGGPENTIEILNITVHPEWRGLDFGRKMLQQVAAYGVQHQAERLILDVRKSNLAAVQLYQKSGFSIQQIRKAFYPEGEDAFHMVLDLTGAAP